MSSLQRCRILFSRRILPPVVSSLRNAASSTCRRTPLFDFHVSQKAKMVPFCGWEMPVQYADKSLAESHIHTRKHVSIFDVSHMLQTRIVGEDRVEFMESLVVADVQGLSENSGSLTVYTTEQGGIIDDLIVNKTKEYLYVVSNAGCAEKDLNHVQTKLAAFQKTGKKTKVEVIDDFALIAVQGPGTATVLSEMVDCNMSKLTFMTTTEATVCGVKGCRVTRCGYTGEDGVEISIPQGKVVEVVQALLASKKDSVAMAGLGARDTLRLEAGLCLYGNDIDETTTPIEAGLAWTIGKRRRETKGFPGADIILEQLKNKPTKRRIGITSTGPPVRSHVPILDKDSGTKIGEVTSGSPSPSLPGTNIAMGYVQAPYAKTGTKVVLDVRKKHVPGTVTKMPFVPSHYYTGTK